MNSYLQEAYHKGLKILTDAYKVQVVEWDGEKKPEGAVRGPCGHAISIEPRKLFFNVSESYSSEEWVHEVGHLIVICPWEPTPRKCNEFSYLFYLESAIGEFFYKKRLWTKEDLNKQDAVQRMYSVDHFTFYWDLSEEEKSILLGACRQNCFLAGLVDDQGAPTFKEPTWDKGNYQDPLKVLQHFFDSKKHTCGVDAK